jgi:hypothetical protein
MAMVRPPVSREQADYRAYQAQQNAVYSASQTYATANPLAQRLVAIDRKFPNMRPSLLLAAAQSNLSDDQIEVLWTRQQEMEAETGTDSRWSGGFWSDALAGVQSVGETAMRNVVKPTTRLTVAAMAAPYELVVGTTASLAAAVGNATGDDDVFGQNYEGGWRNPFAQTRLGQFLANPTADQGDGFFMGGDIEDQTYEAQREAMTLTNDRNGNLGRTFTFGRAVFGGVPGTPGRILEGTTDFAMALAGDPVNYIAPQAKSIGVARGVLRAADDIDEAAGLVRSWRTVVHGPTARAWLDGETGARVIDSFAGTDDAATIWRATNKKIPVQVARELAETADPVEVRKILDRHLGIDVVERPSEILDGGRLARRKYRPETRRLISKLPATVVDPNDLDDMALQLDRSMVQAKVPLADRDRVISELAGSQGPNDTYNALKSYTDAVFDAIIRKDPRRPDLTAAQEEFMSETLRLWTRTTDSSRSYAVDAVGKPMHDQVVVIGGAAGHQAVVGSGPIAWTELLSRNVVLPDARSLRQLTSNHRRFFALSKYVGDEGAVMNVWDSFVIAPLDKFNQFWRSMMLLRGGAMIRNVGEAQLSMAASGYASMFKHPLEYMAYVMGVPGQKATRMLTESLTGTNWIDDAAEEGTIISRTTGKSARMRRDYGKQFTGGHKLYTRGERYFVTAWAEEVARMSIDPIERSIAQALREPDPAGALRALKDDFWDGSLSKFRKGLVDPDDVADGATPRLRQTIGSRQGSDAYIDTELERLQGVVGGNDTILEAIATQRLGGQALTNQKRVSKELMRELRRMADNEQGLPSVFGREAIAIKDEKTGWSMAADGLWDLLYSIPSNRLSLHPGFKQFYAEELGRLFMYGDDAAREAIEQYVPGKMLRRTVNKNAKLPDDVDFLTMAELDRVAQRRALDRAKQVFYDISSDEKVAAWETLRYIMPFGAAWADATKRWAKYTFQNPNLLRRLHQGLNGAESAGIIQEDPETGELMMNLPLSGLAAAGTGIPIGMQGRVAGLNMIAQAYPGVGPVLAIPAVTFLPDDNPAWLTLRDTIAPFTSGKQDIISATLDSLTPGWFDRIQSSVSPTENQKRVHANQVGRNIIYLASTGEYDLTDPAEIRALVDKARRAADTQSFFRGVYQWFSPTAPSFNPKLMLEAGTGAERLGDFYQISKELRDREAELEREGAEDPLGEAATELLARYGPNLYMLLQPMSYSTAYGSEPTAEFDEFRLKNPDVFGEYADIAGLFGPAHGEFSLDSYNRQFRRGERASYFEDGTAKSFEDWVALSQHKFGQVVYRNQLKRLTQMGLDQNPYEVARLKQWVHEQYPGWQRQDIVSNRNKLASSDAIEMLEQLVVDPKMQSMPGVESARTYLQLRRQALAEVQRAGLTAYENGRLVVSEAKAVLPIRLWLAQMGNQLMLRDPYFVKLWDEMLSFEGNIGDAFTEAAGLDAGTGTDTVQGVIG